MLPTPLHPTRLPNTKNRPTSPPLTPRHPTLPQPTRSRSTKLQPTPLKLLLPTQNISSRQLLYLNSEIII
jgi:hypothetical protein